LGAGGGSTPVSGCEAGKVGDFVPWGMGSISAGTSTLPLCTNTLALGLATMTRAGGATTRPDAVVNSAAGLGAGLVAGRSGAGGVVKPRVGTG